MPIKFNLEELRKKYGCLNYFETGLWDPTQDVSSKHALKSNFEKVYCIEIRKDFVTLGKKILQKYIDSGRYFLFLDDSINMKKYLTDKNIFDNSKKSMFFLDAHVDNKDIHDYHTKCPLFYELEAIKSLSRKDNIILIDDLRILKKPFPWGEKTYGDINFLQEIKKKILEINENYKFSTLDGHVKDDVLLCFV